jgi:8-oxo-dGTP pyrophosphatase MutT (NUDIX family)
MTPQYSVSIPVDAPRTYTHPDVLAAAARGESWVDPETDPTRIDWTERQARALIPFQVVNGRPVNPHAPTGIRYGRNELGHWGEQACADALVCLRDEHQHRWILMVERADGHGWALPGGHVDPGEDPAAAAVRELAEETGLKLPDAQWQLSEPRYVPDPRASDEAWMVTVLARTDIGYHRRNAFPPVTGADDALRALWLPADDYDVLADYLADAYGGQVFPAHRDLLAAELYEVF